MKILKIRNGELAKLLNELESLKVKLKNLDEEMLNDKDEIHFKKCRNC